MYFRHAWVELEIEDTRGPVLDMLTAETVINASYYGEGKAVYCVLGPGIHITVASSARIRYTVHQTHVQERGPQSIF